MQVARSRCCLLWVDWCRPQQQQQQLVCPHQLLMLAAVVTVATEGGSVWQVAPMGCRRDVSD